MRHPCAEVAAQAQRLLQVQYPQMGWHDVQAHPLAKGFALTLHATLPAQTTVETAHDLAEQAETFLRSALTTLQRVTIHTEPFDHN
jgi:divalent metal cation (Fe/Co/Zn/Cd) transporter